MRSATRTVENRCETSTVMVPCDAALSRARVAHRAKSARSASGSRLETSRDQPGVLGLRYGFVRDPQLAALADGSLEWLWASAERAGVPISVMAPAAPHEIGRIAQRHP